MSKTEIRDHVGEIRAISETDKTFELKIVSYGTVDSYGSTWEPGVFGESLATRMPPAVWGHNWERVIGSVVEHDDRSDGQYGLVKMADTDEVPDARAAYSLIKDKHVKDTSFGFARQTWDDVRTVADWKPTMAGQKEHIRAARLDEVSPVVKGAVPGARILNVRSEQGTVSRMDAGQLLVAVASGSITLRDALNSLESGENLIPVEPDERAEEYVEISDRDAEFALTLMAMDDRAFATEIRALKGTAALKEYWAHGKGALKIRWGTPGDHTRCVKFLNDYVSPAQVHGLCTNIQKLAIGHAGNKTPAEKGL